MTASAARGGKIGIQGVPVTFLVSILWQLPSSAALLRLDDLDD